MGTGSGVSVVLSTCDGERHLGPLLRSLGAQRRPPAELIVRDDASVDSTPVLLREVLAAAPFPVEVVAGSERLGPVRSFEAALGRAGQEWVALCDQDDRWHPDKLERLLALAEERPASALLFSDGSLVDDVGRVLPGSVSTRLGLTERRLARFGRDPLAVLLERSIVAGCTMMVRRAVLDAALPVPEVVSGEGLAPMLHDRWLALVAATLGEVAYVPDPLIDYRQHVTQVTGFERSRWRRTIDRLVPGGSGWSARAAARADQLDQVAGRAEAAGADADRVRLVREAADHLRRRSALEPWPRRRRFGPVLDEVRRGRYRYSDGPHVAVADLLRPRSSRLPRSGEDW